MTAAPSRERTGIPPRGDRSDPLEFACGPVIVPSATGVQGEQLPRLVDAAELMQTEVGETEV
jgi:hypothetical protein